MRNTNDKVKPFALSIRDEVTSIIGEDREESDILETEQKKPKTPRINREIFTILPFTEPKTITCGQYLPYNYAHISKFKDTKNELGQMEYSAHVIGPGMGGELPQSMVVNCNNIMCDFCNFKHDSNGQIILDSEGNPEPAGAYKRTIESHLTKLIFFQDTVGKIMNLNYPQNYREALKFFYSKHKTNHKKRSVYYTLIDKKMDVKQRKNLQNTLLYAGKRQIPLNIYHHVLSPPNTWSGWDTEDGMNKNTQKAIDILREIGCFGGYIYFHPFRIPEKYNDRVECAAGPHWHFVGFSHIMADVQSEVNKREGIVFKALHHSNGHVEPVKSIFQTLSYILSHVGVQVYREPIFRDLVLMEKYHVINDPIGETNHKLVSFILPLRESNFPYEPLQIDPSVFSDSLNYHLFLKTEIGQHFQLIRRKLIIFLDDEDKSLYLHTIKSNKSKKIRKILMRNFGILSNSKNFIWGFKREKPQYYCPACEDHIAVADMFPCNVLSESLIGVKGPPETSTKTETKSEIKPKTLGDMLIEDMDRTDREEREKKLNEAKKELNNWKLINGERNLTLNDQQCENSQFNEFNFHELLTKVKPYEINKFYDCFKIIHGNSEPEPTEIYVIPLSMIQRVDLNIEDVKRHFFRTRNR